MNYFHIYGRGECCIWHSWPLAYRVQIVQKRLHTSFPNVVKKQVAALFCSQTCLELSFQCFAGRLCWNFLDVNMMFKVSFNVPLLLNLVAIARLISSVKHITPNLHFKLQFSKMLIKIIACDLPLDLWTF